MIFSQEFQDSQQILDSSVEVLEDLKIFNKEEYENLQPDSYEIKVIGNVELNEEEQSALKLHPKFCILDKLTNSDSLLPSGKGRDCP